MSKLALLGGSGAVGRVALQTVASLNVFEDIIVGDLNPEVAKSIADNLPGNITVVKMDANDPTSIKETISRADVVLNCIGPFYKYARPILEVAIETGVNYVDICDDFDATISVFELHEKAIEAGVSALIGMGSSPGIANLLVKHCENEMLDSVESVDIFHAHGGEKVEGAAVIAHRIHSMMMDIPVFLNGEMKYYQLFTDEGEALNEEVDFLHVGRFEAYLYPHPETMTLPKYIKGIKKVTNKGLVLPPEYAELIKSIVRIGMTSEEQLQVKDTSVSPFDFATAYIINERERILKETNFGSERGCLKIIVKGLKSGNAHTIEFSLASADQGMGEGTGIPAALGAIMMAQNLIAAKGVLPPEASVNPLQFLDLMKKGLQLEKFGDDKSPLTVESIDATGIRRKIVL